ncbi:unnamed protein product, partial [Rotaria magnacalcarata]
KRPDTERYQEFSHQVNALRNRTNTSGTSMAELVCLLISIK